jgi:N-acetylmuramoyl-L-alanine amidase
VGAFRQSWKGRRDLLARSGTAVLAPAGLTLVLLASPLFAQTNTTEVRKSAPAGESIHLKPSLTDTTAAAPAAPSPWAMVTTATTTVSAIKFQADPLQAEIGLTVRGEGRLRAFVLTEPPRVVIEGDGLVFGPALGQAALPGQSLISDYRFGALDTATGRLVIDLARPAMLMAFERSTDETVSLRIVSRGPASEPGEPFLLDLSATPEPTPKAHGDRRHLVLIDPGHGGKDPGAVTDVGAIYEKDVVLAVAKRLQATLSATGRYDVRMTRNADVSVTLDRRVAMSRGLKPDLFISLHADTFAGQPQAAAVRGGSVYILADTASNRAAAALADKENAADQRLGAETTTTTGNAAVDNILTDLTSRETRTFASAFQGNLVKSLKGVMQLAREPARGAAFKVLKQAETPAVLIELGYMSHAQDIALLQAPEWQGQVATAISRAVDAYFTRPRSVLNSR